MNESILRLGNISIYGFGLLTVFAFLWASFVFYKKALESHFDDFSIFDGVVLSAFWGFIGGRISFLILNMSVFWNHWSRIFLLIDYPGVDKWGMLLGVALGFYLTTRKNKGKFLDWFDLVTLGASSGMAIFYVGLSLLSFSWQYVIFGFLYLLLFVFFWWMADRYRTWGWYRGKKTSSRSGIITGFSISIWGLFALIEKTFFGNLTWPFTLGSLVLLVGGVALVYIRSGRTWNEDIKINFKHGRK